MLAIIDAERCAGRSSSPLSPAATAAGGEAKSADEGPFQLQRLGERVIDGDATRELADRMPEELRDRSVILTNFIVKAEVAAALRDRLQEDDAGS